MLRTGEKTQDVLKAVQAKTQELNTTVLPKDVKVVPFYDRSDLVHETVLTVERNLLRGMLLVIACASTVILGRVGQRPTGSPAGPLLHPALPSRGGRSRRPMAPDPHQRCP